jgi:DNA-binding IclR family transcriptional regulator
LPLKIALWYTGSPPMTEIDWLREQVLLTSVSEVARRLGFPRPTVLSLLAGLANPPTVAKLSRRRAALA